MTNKDNKNLQELSLEIKLDKYSTFATYTFIVNSKYINKNGINFEYYVEYEGKFFNNDIFNMDNNKSNKLFIDFENTIIDKVKELNPIIREKQPKFKKEDSLTYKIDLIFQDSESVFSNVNIENIFKSIISILKDRNVELKETPLNELINKRNISILFNNKNLENLNIKIEDRKRDGLYAYITYDNDFSIHFVYKIKLYIKTGESDKVEIDKFSINIDYQSMLNSYKDFLEYIEILNPNRLLNRIINPIVQNEYEIKKFINNFEFHNAITVIDKLVNGNYNKEIIEKLKREIKNEVIGYKVDYYSEGTPNLITYLTFNLKDYIKC